ncbi:uncharacterized protein LOC110715960 isoform X2 [Chenopodium quinoa]|uniref:RING-type domain-containing protein n=1 Tax=Chenopodium quinoa TaxID=63459 RepID=A0A803M8Z6_CHEQI|nr:uncharacterized protein LOC110715960 isoform X2 [Chenopodium quinoa]
MSNKGEKEAGKERQSAARVLGTPRQTRSGRFSENTAVKSCPTPVSCSSNKKKKSEEASGAAKKAAIGGVTENAPRKSGTKTVSSTVWKARDLKHTAASLAQKEAGGGQETAQVTHTPRIGKQPNTPAKKTEDKITSSQQVWREKARLDSTDKKKLSAKRQQSQPPGVTTRQSSKLTDSSPSTSKSKKSAIQKQVEGKEPSPKEKSSKGKQVQKKKTEHQASTSKLHLEPESYRLESESYRYHIQWDGYNKPDIQIGVCCSLCEEDLGVAPDSEGDYYGEGEFATIPVVAILSCGHSFHYVCLNLGELEGQQGDPPCVFCESFMS